MDSKTLTMVVFSLLGFLAAFTYAYFNPTTIILGAEINLPITLLTLINFFFGTIFFGYLAFIPSLLFGLQLGSQKNAAIFLHVFPLVLSTYAGTKLGFFIEADFWKTKNFLEIIKRVILFIIIAIIIAIIIEHSLPYLIKFWPTNTGLELQEGETILGVLEQLNTLRK